MSVGSSSSLGCPPSSSCAMVGSPALAAVPAGPGCASSSASGAGVASSSEALMFVCASVNGGWHLKLVPPGETKRVACMIDRLRHL